MPTDTDPSDAFQERSSQLSSSWYFDTNSIRWQGSLITAHLLRRVRRANVAAAARPAQQLVPRVHARAVARRAPLADAAGRAPRGATQPIHPGLAHAVRRDARVARAVCARLVRAHVDAARQRLLAGFRPASRRSPPGAGAAAAPIPGCRPAVPVHLFSTQARER